VGVAKVSRDLCAGPTRREVSSWLRKASADNTADRARRKRWNSPSVRPLNFWNEAKRLNDWNVWNWPQHALAIERLERLERLERSLFYGGLHLSRATYQLLYKQRKSSLSPFLPQNKICELFH
jgi:hypothetical protein